MRPVISNHLCRGCVLSLFSCFRLLLAGCLYCFSLQEVTTALHRFGSFNDQRSSGIYDRHTDRHTDRFDRRDGAGQSTMPVASRYTDRRGDAAVRREPVRDRDDRAKYSR